MKIVYNWKAHLRRYSVIALGAAGTLQVTWLAIPQSLKDSLPAWFVQGFSLAIVAAGLVGAFVNQGIAAPEPAPAPPSEGETQ